MVKHNAIERVLSNEKKNRFLRDERTDGRTRSINE